MPPFNWDTAAARMDAAVDNTLGNDFQISLDGGDTFTDQKGFYLPVTPDTGIAPFDEHLGSKPRVKMAKSIIGEDPPSHYILLRCAKIGPGDYRPGNAEPDDQGRYWIFEVQKA